MQYIYTQEEHDHVRTDKEAFEKRVTAEVESRLSLYRKSTGEVLNDFVTELGRRGDPFRPFGVSISVDTLQKLSKEIKRAHGIHDSETCDKGS